MFIVAALLAVQAQAPRPPVSVVVGGSGKVSAEHMVEFRKVAELGCRRGQQNFCYDLAGLLRFGVGGPTDRARANQLLRHACREGHQGACGKIEP